jgi:hypothetical protein
MTLQMGSIHIQPDRHPADLALYGDSHHASEDLSRVCIMIQQDRQ